MSAAVRESERTLRVRHFFLLGTLLYLQFFLVYGGSNRLAALQAERYRFYFDWELAIPFVPQFLYIYLSLSLFLLLPLRYLRLSQLRPWALSYMWMTFLAGTIFLLLPTEVAQPRHLLAAQSQPLLALLYTLDGPHNLFPSLHVAYTTLALLMVLGSGRRDGWLWPILLWWSLLLASVLLVHQHHTVDIAAGLLLAAFCYRYIYRRGVVKYCADGGSRSHC